MASPRTDALPGTMPMGSGVGGRGGDGLHEDGPSPWLHAGGLGDGHPW